MAEAAKAVVLPWPEAAVVEDETLEGQTAAVAAALPRTPLVLGGCCCAHIGAIRGLAARHGRLAVVWLDAHGDLNTPETSPSGNAWGMPLRMSLDEGAIEPADVALVGARDLDPAEEEYVAAIGIDDDIAACSRRRRGGLRRLRCRRARPGGDRLLHAVPGRAERRVRPSEILRRVAAGGLPIAGLGFSGLRPRLRSGDADRSRRSARRVTVRPTRQVYTCDDVGSERTPITDQPSVVNVSIEHKRPIASPPCPPASEHLPGLRLALP